MVVLNIWGIVEPVVISQKLGLYVSNFRNSQHEDWASELRRQITVGRSVIAMTSYIDLGSIDRDIEGIYGVAIDDNNDWASQIVDKMIFIDQDYSYDEMSLGDWETNCFDGRLCEGDYAEKLINFLASISASTTNLAALKGAPVWIYSSNYDKADYERLLFWGGLKPEISLEFLKTWGQYLDGFLETREDYLLLDYLINAYHFDSHKDEYHILKTYSLCQLFLEKNHESELDSKLPRFLSYYDSSKDREDCAPFLRKIRNKLAHGDFRALDGLLEQFAERFMDGCFWFDYSEFSRRNWIIGHIGLILDTALHEIVLMLFFDRNELERIKRG